MLVSLVLVLPGQFGGGVFTGGSQGTNAGAFGSSGAFAGGPGWGTSTPAIPSGGTSAAVGAFAGAGVGPFVTNATRVADLLGPFNTYTVNVGVGAIQGTIQVGVSNGIWIATATFGPGAGVSARACFQSSKFTKCMLAAIRTTAT